MKMTDEMRQLIDVVMNDELDISKRKQIIMDIVPEFIACNECMQEHPAHIYNVLDHTMKVVCSMPYDEVGRLAALFHDIAKPICKVRDGDVCHYYGHDKEGCKLTFKVLSRLNYDTLKKNHVVYMVRYHDTYIQEPYSLFKYVVDAIGIENVENFKKLQEADLNAHAPWYAKKHSERLFNAHVTINHQLRRYEEEMRRR